MTADFGGHLNLSANAAASQIVDSSNADLPLVALTKIQYSLDNGSTWVTWTSLSQATLTMTNSVQTFVDTDTIVSNVIWTGRKKDINNWTVACVEHNTDRSRFVKGQQMMLRLYVDGTHFWELKWGKVKGFTGIQVSAQTGAIIQQTVTVEMNMNDDGVVSAAPGVLGWVKKPDATTWLGAGGSYS